VVLIHLTGEERPVRAYILWHGDVEERIQVSSAWYMQLWHKYSPAARCKGMRMTVSLQRCAAIGAANRLGINRLMTTRHWWMVVSDAWLGWIVGSTLEETSDLILRYLNNLISVAQLLDKLLFNRIQELSEIDFHCLQLANELLG